MIFKNKKITYILIFCLILIFISSIALQKIITKNKELNKSFTVNTQEIYFDKLPDSFNNYKILQISDLHSAEFGKDNSQLLNKINKINPDIIMFTGDMFNFYEITDKDSDETNLPSFKLINTLAKSYKILYITGNHEENADIIYHGWDTASRDRSNNDAYNRYLHELENAGVTFIDDSSIKINKNNESINVYGIYFFTAEKLDENHYLDKLKVDKNKFNIMLAHDPKYFETYADNGFDLILSGHTHGGIIRLPYIGGLLSPDKKIFPKYDKGIFKYKNSYMNVSGGLGGNSSFKGINIIRINNQPEINLITLKLKNKEI